MRRILIITIIIGLGIVTCNTFVYNDAKKKQDLERKKIEEMRHTIDSMNHVFDSLYKDITF